MRAIGEINQALQCCGMAWVYLGLLGILRIRHVSTWSLTEAGSAEMPTLLRHTQPFHACLYRIRNIDMSVYTYVIYCVYIYICIFRDTYIHVHIGVYTWTPTRSLRTPHTLRTLRSMLRRFVVQDGPWRLQWPSAASSRMVDLWDLSGFFKDVVGTILQFHSFLFETWTCFFLAPFILGITMPAKILWACQMGLSHEVERRAGHVRGLCRRYSFRASLSPWAPTGSQGLLGITWCTEILKLSPCWESVSVVDLEEPEMFGGLLRRCIKKRIHMGTH
jgi:hypothetical protein